jgi:hypothetical protein
MTMKRLSLLPGLLLALTVAGCSSVDMGKFLPGNVGKFVTAVTTTVTNPVRSIDIYRVKNVHAATLEIGVKYRKFCWSKPYAALLADPVGKAACKSRRAVVLALQDADSKAFAAISAADRFVRDNPTVNATSAITAAWTAVTDFQSLATRTASLAR